MARTCRLCGRQGGRFTRDHVPPQWVTKTLPGDGHQFTVRRGGDDEPHRERTAKKTHDHTVRICADCHDDLTNGLDTWASNALQCLVERPTRLPTYGVGEQNRIAAWCFRIAVIHDLTQVESLIPESARMEFRRSLLPPPGIGVWAGRFVSGHDVWIDRHRSTFPLTAGGTVDVCTFTVRLGHFAFQVVVPLEAGFPSMETRVVAGLIRLWPPDGRRGRWHPEMTPMLSPERFAEAHTFSSW